MSSRRYDIVALAPTISLLLFVAVGLFLESYRQYVIAIALVSMLTGVALVIVVGLARCITLAAGSITALGAYAAAVSMLRLDISYPIALFIAAMAGAIAGWMIAVPGTRFRGHNLAMVTLVFQAVCVILIRESTWLTGGAQGMRVPVPGVFGWKITTDADFLIFIGGVSAAIVLLLTILIRGPYGKNLQAVAANEMAAEAYGISVPGYISSAFVISSIVIALSGALAAPRVRILDPDSYGVMLSISMLAYPIVGGMQSIWGGLLGGGVMRVMPEVLRSFADYQELFFAILVMVVVMFFPGGLVELLRRGVALVVKDTAPATEAGRPKEAYVRSLQNSHMPPAEAPAPLLVLTGVDKYFDALHAVDNVSLTVPSAGIHGLIGPNGAGKTSLFNIVAGFVEADCGQISFGAAPLLSLKARDRVRLGITRTFQNVAIFGHLSCIDNVIIGFGRNGISRSIAASFEQFAGTGTAAYARRDALAVLDAVGLINKAGSPAGSLSLGDQRRLEIARAIVSNPRMIMLDEPVSGLAETEVDGLRELLLRINADRDIAMLVVEHNIPFVADICRTISVMGAGSIVAEGKPAEVLSLPLVRQLYFGEDVGS